MTKSKKEYPLDVLLENLGQLIYQTKEVLTYEGSEGRGDDKRHHIRLEVFYDVPWVDGDGNPIVTKKSITRRKGIVFQIRDKDLFLLADDGVPPRVSVKGASSC